MRRENQSNLHVLGGGNLLDAEGELFGGYNALILSDFEGRQSNFTWPVRDQMVVELEDDVTVARHLSVDYLGDAGHTGPHTDLFKGDPRG